MNIKEKIGTRIRDAREKLNLTREQLAKRTANLNAPRIGNWELGLRSPGPNEIMTLAKALDVSPSYLSCFTDHDDTKEKFANFVQMKTVPILALQDAVDYKNFITNDPYELLEKHDHVILDDRTATKLDKESFAIQLIDESMAPLFHSQDLIIITPCSDPNPGTFVLATIRDSDRAVFRKYREITKTASGKVKFELLPLNDDWPSVTVNNKNDGVILGTMAELRRYA